MYDKKDLTYLKSLGYTVRNGAIINAQGEYQESVSDDLGFSLNSKVSLGEYTEMQAADDSRKAAGFSYDETSPESEYIQGQIFDVKQKLKDPYNFSDIEPDAVAKKAFTELHKNGEVLGESLEETIDLKRKLEAKEDMISEAWIKADIEWKANIVAEADLSDPVEAELVKNIEEEYGRGENPDNIGKKPDFNAPEEEKPTNTNLDKLNRYQQLRRVERTIKKAAEDIENPVAGKNFQQASQAHDKLVREHQEEIEELREIRGPALEEFVISEREGIKVKKAKLEDFESQLKYRKMLSGIEMTPEQREQQRVEQKAMSGYQSDSDLLKERDRVALAIETSQDIIAQAESYMNGDLIYNPFSSGKTRRDLSTLGYGSIFTDLTVSIPLQNKINNGEKLTDGELMLQQAWKEEARFKNLGIEQTKAYEITEGFVNTIPFMLSMAATSGIGGAVQTGIKTGVKRIIPSTLKTKAKQSAKLSFIGNAALNTVAGGSKLLVQPLFMRSTATNALDRYIDQYQMAINPETGDLEPQFGDQLRATLVAEIDSDINFLNGELSKAQSSGNSDKVREISDTINILKKEKDKVGAKASILNAGIGGLLDNSAEIATEFLVGPALARSKALVFGGKVTPKGAYVPDMGKRTLMGRSLDKLKATSPVRTYKESAFKKFTDAATLRGVQKSINSLAGSKMVGGFSDELLEEVAVNFIPKLEANGYNWSTYKDQVAETFTTDFFSTTAGVVGLTQGLFGLPGGIQNIAKNTNKTSREAKAFVKSLKDANLSDSELKNLMMNAGFGNFSAQDYQNQIREARAKDTLEGHKKADQLEGNYYFDMAMAASSAGQGPAFKRALSAAKYNENVSPETLKAMTEVHSYLDTIERNYGAVSEMENAHDIMSLISKKRYNETLSKGLQSNLTSLNLDSAVIEEYNKTIEKAFGAESVGEVDLTKQENKEILAKYVDGNNVSQKVQQKVVSEVIAIPALEEAHKNIENTLEAFTNKTFQAKRVAERELTEKSYEEASSVYGDDFTTKELSAVIDKRFKRTPKELSNKELANLKAEILNIHAFAKGKEKFSKEVAKRLKKKQQEVFEATTPEQRKTISQVGGILGAREVDPDEDYNLPDTPEMVEALAEVIKVPVEHEMDLEAGTGTAMPFSEVIDYLLAEGLIEQDTLKEDFEILGKAYDTLGHGPSNWKEEYNSRYNSLKDKMGALASFMKKNSVTENPEVENNQNKKANVEGGAQGSKSSAEKVKLDGHDMPVNEPASEDPNAILKDNPIIVRYSPVKTQTVVTPEVDANGNPTGRTTISYKREAIPEMREDGFITYSALAHPEKNNIGDKLSVEVVDEQDFDEVFVPVRDKNGVPKLTENGEPRVITFNEWRIANKPEGMSFEDFAQTDEYISRVPMVYVDANGDRVGYISDPESINKVTVKDPANFEENNSEQHVVDFNSPSKYQTEEIQKAKDEANALRKAIYSGEITSVEIIENKNNPFAEIAEYDDNGNLVLPKPLSEVAKDSSLAFMMADGTFQDLDGNPIDTSNIINLDTYLEKESVIVKKVHKEEYKYKLRTFYLNRVSDVNGEKRYKIHTTLRKNSLGESAVEPKEKETVKWLAILNNALLYMDHKTGSKFISARGGGAVFNGVPTLTKEEAKAIAAQVKDITKGKVDLYNKKHLLKAISSIAWLQVGKGKTNDINAVRKASLNPDSIFVQNTELGYGDTPTFSITLVDGKFVVEKTADTYPEALKDRLSTNLMGYNVGTEANPIFINEPHQVVHVKPVLNKKPSVEEKIEDIKNGGITITPASTPKEVNTKEEGKKTASTDEEITKALKDGLALFHALNIPFSFGGKKEGIAETINLPNLTSEAAGIEGLSISEQIDVINHLVSILSKKNITAAEAKADFLGYFNEVGTILSNKILNYIDVLEGTGNTKLKDVIDAAGKALDTTNAIIDNYNKILSKAQDIAKRNTFLTEDIDEDIEEAETYTKGTNEKFGIDKVGVELKRLFAKISNEQVGTLGLPKYDSFKTMYDNVLGILSNSLAHSTSFSTAMQILDGHSKAHPWMEAVVEELRKSPIEVQNKFMYNMYRHNVHAKMVVFSTIPSISGIQGEVWASNSNTALRKAKVTWKNNFQRSIITDGSEINVDTLNGLIDDWNKNIDSWKKGEQMSSLKSWAATFGITLSDKTWDAMKRGELYSQSNGRLTPATFESLFGDGQGNLFNNLITYASKNSDRDNYDYVENPKEHPFNDMGSILTQLATLEIRYNPKYMSSSRRVAGKSLTEVEPTNHFYEQIGKLKRSAVGDKTYLRTLEKLSFSSNSHILYHLINSPEFAEIYEDQVVDILALTELHAKDPMYAGIADLPDVDYMFHQRIMFQDQTQSKIELQSDGIDLRVGILSMPTSSDKGRMMTVKTAVYDLFKSYQSYFSGVTEGQLDFTDTLKELLYTRLVEPELNRILKFNTDILSTDIKGYDSGATRFNLTPALNTIKNEEGLTAIEYLSSEEASAEEFKKLFGTAATKILQESIISEMNSNVKKFTEAELISASSNLIHDATYLKGNTLDPQQKILVAELDYIINAKIGLMENMQLIAGDPALYYKAKGDVTSTDTQTQENISRELGINLGKRLASMIAPGQVLPDSEGGSYLQIFLEDVVEVADGIKDLIEMFYGPKAYTTEVEGLLEDNDTEVLKEMFPKIADYFEIETTDAQEYTTLKEHLYILEKQGKITYKKAKALQKKVDKGQILTDKDLETVFQPIKPVYTGGVVDTEQDVNRMMYIKSSSFPLLPQLLTEGSKLDRLRMSMESLEKKHKTTVRASYQTANKVGASTNTVDVNNMPAGEVSFLKLDRKNFKIQQEVPFKSSKKQKDTVSMGTQIFKLLFGNGILNHSGKIDFQGEEITVEDLHSKFLSTYGDLIDIERSKLLTDLGLNENFETTDQKRTVEKFQELLTSEAKTRGFSQQDLDALGIIESFDSNNRPAYDFKVPLWMLANSNKYEAMLNAIITNRILKQKLPGNGFVVGSKVGLELSKTTKKQITTSNTLSAAQKELILQSIGETTVPDCA